MSNWLKAESRGSDCGFDQVEKCDLFPYHFLPLFISRRITENQAWLKCHYWRQFITLLPPKKKKKKKNYSWKWSLNGLSDGRNMVFWIRATARSGTNDLRGCTSRWQNGPLFVPGWFRNWSHTEHKGKYWHGRCFPQRIEDVRQPATRIALGEENV